MVPPLYVKRLHSGEIEDTLIPWLSLSQDAAKASVAMAEWP